MKKVILLRYGELFLKGRNKRYFENTLIDNIKSKLEGLEFGFYKQNNRYFIKDFDESRLNEFIERLKKVFGLHSLSVAYELETDYAEICKAALSVAPNKGTFRVTVNRADKTLDKTSTQIACEIGDYILRNRDRLSVDLHEPQHTVFVDIRESGVSYIFSEMILCAQGMPIGTAGRGMLLLSGGIDSPVAGYKIAQRGMELSAVYFHSDMFVSEQAKQKVVELAEILSDYAGPIKLFVIPFSDIQLAIHEKCNEEFMITVMRRFMVAIAEKLAIKAGCGALITGESLGQVASQTVESITVSNEACKSLPIFRPLIGMDKSEIVTISEKIGTYDVSIRPFADCCTAFLPKNPVIKPKLSIAKGEQSKIANCEDLIDRAIENVEVIRIGDKLV